MVKNDFNDIQEDGILKEETQPGVTVYRDIASAPLHAGVIDMDVAAGIDELTLKYDLCMAESKKSFPDVKRLVIDEMVFRIEMPNTLFPNVRHVLSYSHMFESGEYLIGRTYGFTSLVNVFCHDMDEVIDLGNVAGIDDLAFKGCECTNVTGGKNIKNKQNIEPKAFAGSALEKKAFENGIRSIGYGHVILGVDYTADEINIPDDKFKNVIFSTDIDFSKIKKLIIHKPETIEQINYRFGFPETLVLDTDLLMFEQDVARIAHTCTIKHYIKNFSISSPEFKEIDGIAYTRNGNKLVACSAGKEHVVVPDGVKTIGKYAFANCHIKSLILPDSVTTIGAYAFEECKDLESVVLGGNIEVIGENAFESCKKSTSIVIPPNVYSIGDYAFLHSGLEDIRLNEGLQHIGAMAFSGTKIKSLQLPASVVYLRTECIDDTMMEVIMPSFKKDVCKGFIKTFRPFLKNDTVLRLRCGERCAYIPRYMRQLTVNEGLSSIESFFTDTEKKAPDIWKYAYTALCKQNMAFLEYNKFGSESAKEYLKKNAKKIALRFIEYDKEELAVRLVKTGLMSKMALKELLDKAEEKDMTVLQSYIMQYLNDGKRSKQNFHI